MILNIFRGLMAVTAITGTAIALLGTNQIDVVFGLVVLAGAALPLAIVG